MKRLTYVLLAALMLCTGYAEAKVRTIVERDAQGNKKRVIEVVDTMLNGKACTDTLSIMTYEKSVPDSETTDSEELEGKSSEESNAFQLDFDISDKNTAAVIISVTAIVFVFGLPALLLFIIFYFRHKSRKAKYRLAEQAIAAGQPLPAEFFKGQGMEEKSTLNKGISNICLGIGLFIFLWAITEEFGLGCIGLLIMFTGFGQVIIHYVNQPHKKQAEMSSEDNDEIVRNSNL